MAKKDSLKQRIRRNTSSAGRSITTEEGLEVAQRITEQANDEGIECALCGGLAMHLYGFTRATRDVDFVASDFLSLRAERELSFGGKVYYKMLRGKRIEVDWIVRNDEKQAAYDAALGDALETDVGVDLISPEWMVILKYLAGRGKDHIDVMWLLREPDLVDREAVTRLVKKLLGKAAFWAIRDLEELFLEADLLRARDER